MCDPCLRCQVSLLTMRSGGGAPDLLLGRTDALVLEKDPAPSECHHLLFDVVPVFEVLDLVINFHID